MVAAAPHVPVLVDRVVELLLTAPDGMIVDATLGAGGHARAVLAARAARYGTAHLIGLDRDPVALEIARDRLADLGPATSSVVVATRFDQLGEVLDAHGVDRIAGVLFDLGISSMHVDRPERGFSYRHDGPLDMRMGPDARRTAADVVNTYERRELVRVLRVYGEERFAERIAGAIVRARPLTSTTQLAEVVRGAIPAAARRTGGHPATRTFQALRIEVNGELEAFERALPTALDRLVGSGVAVTLAYHSLEDRIAKRTFADAARGCICPPGFPVCACGRVPSFEPVVRRPERASAEEVAANPRASAARLRALRRMEMSP